MKYVGRLTHDELATSESAQRNHPSARVRARAHLIILSHKGYQIKDIADICGMVRRTVSAVTDEWERYGLGGSDDNPRPGRPRSLTPEDGESVYEMVEEQPRSAKKIIAILGDRRGKKSRQVRDETCYQKKNRWKRIRKSPGGKRDEKKFREAMEEIASEEQRRENGETDLSYSDEAGFFPTPCVPYAWQPKGESVEVPPTRGKGTDVLAFTDKDNDCVPSVSECTTDTDIVIACSDSFVGTITKQTIVYMDNSPVRKSNKFLCRISDWEEKGLHIRFLPEYSPEPNLIEILWRKIKYGWLPFSAYISFEKLTECVGDILANFGFQHIIEFA